MTSRKIVDLPQGSGLGPELLARGFALRVAFTGGSMRPFLHHGDFLLVEPAPSPPRYGDVLLFRAGGILVAHRYLGGDETYYQTKGDALPGPAETVPAADVLGRVVGYERARRRVSIDCGVFRLLHPAAACLSPWLPGLMFRLMPRPLRRAARVFIGAGWGRAAKR